MSPAERFEGLPTPPVSDALDRLGIPGQVPGIRAVAGARLCGPAFTVRYVPITGRPGTVGDYIDEVPADHVVVLDNGGILDATVWGDLLTRAAVGRGLAGTVIHGVCRDAGSVADSTEAAGYPVFARGRYMRTGKGRVRVARVGEVVSVGGAAVEPGDTLLGDRDGLLVIPAGRLDEVVSLAREIEAAEEAIRRRLDGGSRLDHARRELGYHGLQEPS